MSETQHFQAAEAPGEQRTRPNYTLASPEFFHLLSRIDQLDNKVEQKIERLEQRLEQTDQKIDKLQGWVIATLLTVALSTVGLVLFR